MAARACCCTVTVALLLLLASLAPTAGQAASYTAGLLYPQILEPQWLTAEAAVHLAVHHINERNFSVVGQEVGAALTPGFRLELVYYPGLSSDAPNLGQRAAEDVYAAHSNDGAIAVIGPYTSREALQAASVASVLQVPLLSFTSSSTELNDRQEYPFFKRINPDAEYDARTLASVVARYGWNQFGFIVSDDAYGRNMEDEMKPAADDWGLQMTPFVVPFNDAEGMAQRVEAMVASQLRIFVTAVYSIDIAMLMQQANSAGIMGPGYVWLCIQADPSQALNDTVNSAADVAALRPNMQGVLWLRNSIKDGVGSGNRNAFQLLSRSLIETDSALYAPPELASRMAASTVLPLEYSAYGYDAVWTLALGLTRTERVVASSDMNHASFRQALLSELYAVQFQGASGLVTFTENGNRSPENIANTLYYLDIQGDAPATGHWIPTIDFVGAAPPVSEDTPDMRVTPVLWPSGSTDVPQGGTACAQGLTFDWRSNRCVYLVAYVAAFTSTISMRNVLAAQVAIHHVNTRNASIVADAASLPEDFQIKLEMFDTRFSPAGGVEGGLDAYGRGAIGVIGAARSSACVPLSHVLLASQTPAVSFACSSESLSSQESFPFFARTIPTDAEAAKLMARTMVAGFGWKRIGVLFQEDDYGFGVYQEFQNSVRQVAERAGVNVATDLQIGGAPLSPGLMRQSLQEMKDSGFRVFVVILITNEDEFVRELQTLGMYGKGYTYVTPDFRFDRVTEMDAGVVSQLMQGTLRMQWNPVIEPQYSNMASALAETPVSSLHPLLVSKLEAAGFDMEDWIAESVGGRVFPFAVYTYDAVWALALGLAKSEREVDGWLQEDCGRNVNCHGVELVERIRGQTFQGASGKIKFNRVETSEGVTVFNANRDGTGINFPIEYWNSTLNQWVAVGQYEEDEDGVGALNLHSTLVWPGFVTVKPEDGSGCPASLYYNSTSTQCEDCGYGSFSAVKGRTSCSLCLRGQYCATTNCVSCDSCTVDKYQDQEGQSKCKSCPRNTVAQTRGASSLEDCRCREGFYRRDGRPGRECFPCPIGGVCLGGLAEPFPADGYWGDWSLVNTSVPDSKEAQQDIHTTVFHECRINEHCTSNCTTPLQTERAAPDGSSLPEFLYEGSDPCRGNVTKQCSVGREGRLCASCQPGYFLLSDKCMTCRKPETLFVVGTVICIILFWYLINRVVASKYEAVDLMLIYLQNASTITAFNLNWDPALVNYAFWALAIVNFDVTFISPTCTWQSWSYGHGLFLQLILPIIVAAIYVSLYLANWILLRALFSRGHGGHSSVSVFGAAGEAKVIGWVGALMDRLGFAKSWLALSLLGDEYIANSTNFLNVLYHTLTLKSQETLFCRRLPDDSQYLQAGPEVMCWTKQHAGLLVGSMLGLVVYTIGIPLFFFLVLRYGRTYNLFRNARFMRQWGWLYLRYEKDWYFWEVVIMIRRGLLVTVLVTCQWVPSLQMVVGVALVTALITSHFYARPFISTSLDLLDTFSLVSLMGLLCTGMLFYDTYGPTLFSSWRITVTVLCHAQLLGCMLMVAGMVYQDVRYEEALKRMTRKLRRMIAFAVHAGVDADSGEGSATPQANAARRSSLGGMVAWVSSRVIRTSDGLDDGVEKDGVSRKEYQVAKMLSKEAMELTKTLDEGALSKWLQKLQELQEADAGGDKGAGVSSKAMAKVGRAATKMFLRASDEESNSVQLREGVIRFWLCNHWTKDVLSDTSPLSYYSQHQYALFFGNLVNDNPYLLDYLLRAAPEQREVAKEVFAEMRDSQVNFSRHGQLASLVSDLDKGPLLAWILLADEEAITILRNLMVDVYEANQGEGAIEEDTTQRAPALLRPIDWLINEKLPTPNRLGMQNSLRRRPVSEFPASPDGDGAAVDAEDRALLQAKEQPGEIAAWGGPVPAWEDAPGAVVEVEGEAAAELPGLAAVYEELGATAGVSSQPGSAVSRVAAAQPAAGSFTSKGTAQLTGIAGSGRALRAGKAPVAGQPSRRKRRKLERKTSITAASLPQFDEEVRQLSNHRTALGQALLELERKIA